MKYAILSVAVTLMLGGCAVEPTSPNGIYAASEQGSSVRPFPANLHGGQPYMSAQGDGGMQHCMVTATHFEPPAALNDAVAPSDNQPIKLIAASCWL